MSSRGCQCSVCVPSATGCRWPCASVMLPGCGVMPPAKCDCGRVECRIGGVALFKPNPIIGDVA